MYAGYQVISYSNNQNIFRGNMLLCLRCDILDTGQKVQSKKVSQSGPVSQFCQWGQCHAALHKLDHISWI